MEKRTVKHACGHEAVHALTGTAPERRAREEWLRRQPCQACWRAEQAASAAAQGRQWDLPALDGTDEEKAWAEVIRTKALAHNKDYRRRLVESGAFDQEDEAMRSTIISAADDAVQELEKQCSAAWWIANRFEALGCVKQRVVAAVAPILKARDKR